MDLTNRPRETAYDIYVCTDCHQRPYFWKIHISGTSDHFTFQRTCPLCRKAQPEVHQCLTSTPP